MPDRIVALASANHIWPSGPLVMPNGDAPAEGIANSVICVPFVALVGIRAILPTNSVNQIAPSLPGAIWNGPLATVGVVNSVTWGANAAKVALPTVAPLLAVAVRTVEKPFWIWAPVTPNGL